MGRGAVWPARPRAFGPRSPDRPERCWPGTGHRHGCALLPRGRSGRPGRPGPHLRTKPPRRGPGCRCPRSSSATCSRQRTSHRRTPRRRSRCRPRTAARCGSSRSSRHRRSLPSAGRWRRKGCPRCPDCRRSTPRASRRRAAGSGSSLRQRRGLCGLKPCRGPSPRWPLRSNRRGRPRPGPPSACWGTCANATARSVQGAER